jgi:hypothetical protein
MKRVLRIAVVTYLVLMVLVVVGAYLLDRSRRATGPVVTQFRPVTGFSVVRVSGQGTVRLAQGDTESLTIQAQEDILPLIRSRVDGGTLYIELKSRWPRGLRPTKPVQYDVTVRHLSRIETSGSVNVQGENLESETLAVETSGSAHVDLDVNANSLEATSSGAASFSMRGRTDSQSVDMSGAGKYEAADLDSRTCRVKISGSGKAEVKVSEELDVTISGSGKVAYLGDPEVTKSISGAGKVERLD